MNNFTETTTVSFVQKIKNAFFGVIFGLILFIAAFFLLWWNEGNCVKIAKMNDFVKKNVISVDSNSINPAYNNKLIHTTGEAISKETISDGLVSVKNAIALDREVEMYQWKEVSHTEKQKNMGGSTTEKTTYTYEKDWESFLINSADFKESGHQNPTEFPMDSTSQYAKSVTVGAFNLTPDQIKQINADVTLNKLPANPNYKAMEGYYYSGKSPSAPEIGDYKIAYTYVPSQTPISIIGGQYNNYIVKYITPQGAFSNLTTGTASAEEIMANLDKQNVIITMILRVVGILMIWFGLSLLINPITIIADFIPILSYIVDAIAGFVLGLISLALGLITIALAWLAFRPFIAIPAIALLGYFIYWIIQRRGQKQESPTQV